MYPCINDIKYLDLPDLDYSLRPKLSTHDIHRRYIEDEDVYTYYFYEVSKLISNFLSVVDDITEVLVDITLKKSSNYYDIILSPVGLCHPYHIATRKGVEGYLLKCHQCGLDDTVITYYVDKPYYQYRYVKEMYDSFKSKLSLLKEIISPEVDKESLVMKTFKDVYPTELGMMRFSKDILTNESDIYLTSGDSLVDRFTEVLR